MEAELTDMRRSNCLHSSDVVDARRALTSGGDTLSCISNEPAVGNDVLTLRGTSTGVDFPTPDAAEPEALGAACTTASTRVDVCLAAHGVTSFVSAAVAAAAAASDGAGDAGASSVSSSTSSILSAFDSLKTVG